MAVQARRLQFGPERGRIVLLTTRDGLAAQAGHDLTIEVTQWSAELEVADDLTPAALTVRVDMNSLVVREGKGGMKPLTDRDRREIAVTARKLLRTDRFPEATFTASGFDQGASGNGAVQGTLSLAGSDRPVRCKTCALLPVCKKRLSEKKSNSADGFFKPIDSVIQKFKENDVDIAEAQLMCWRPGSTGLVYPRFNSSLGKGNVISMKDAYETLVGTTPRSFISEMDLLHELKKAAIPIYAGVD